MPESRTLGTRLHRGYYLLAVFEVVTVAGALYLAHRMTAMFDESLAANRAWQQRVRAYAALDESLADVRPPLDELFVSEDLPEERRRFASALATFDRLAAGARQEALQGIEGDDRTLIQNDFDDIARAQKAMVQEADRVFEAFTPEHTDRAARMLGLAEQYLLALRKATVKLQDDAIASSVRTLEAQEQAAEALRGSETVVGTSIVVMVIAATLYGRRISLRMQAADEEHARHLTAIRENELVLRQTEERLQLAARATNDALWDWELGPDVVWWNDAFATLFARSGEFPSLETLNALIHPDDRERVARSLRQFLSSPSEVWTAEYRVRRADGAYAWVLDRGYAIRGEDGTARKRRIDGLSLAAGPRHPDEHALLGRLGIVQEKDPLAVGRDPARDHAVRCVAELTQIAGRPVPGPELVRLDPAACDDAALGSIAGNAEVVDGEQREARLPGRCVVHRVPSRRSALGQGLLTD